METRNRQIKTYTKIRTKTGKKHYYYNNNKNNGNNKNNKQSQSHREPSIEGEGVG